MVVYYFFIKIFICAFFLIIFFPLYSGLTMIYLSSFNIHKFSKSAYLGGLMLTICIFTVYDYFCFFATIPEWIFGYFFYVFLFLFLFSPYLKSCRSFYKIFSSAFLIVYLFALPNIKWNTEKALLVDAKRIAYGVDEETVKNLLLNYHLRSYQYLTVDDLAKYKLNMKHSDDSRGVILYYSASKDKQNWLFMCFAWVTVKGW